MARNRKRANRRPTRPQQRPSGPRPGAAGPQANGRTEVEAQDPQDAGLAPAEVDADFAGDESEANEAGSHAVEAGSHAVEAGSPAGEAGSPDEGAADEPEAAADREPHDGLEPIDLDATNIQPLDLGLDTGLTPEVDIAAGAERAAADERRAEAKAQEPVAEGEDSEDSEDSDDADEAEEEPEDEDVEEFLEEHPEDAAETEAYEDRDDVADDADLDYDEDGEPDDYRYADEPDEDDESDDDRGNALATVPSGRRPRARERKQTATPPSTDVAHPRVSPPARLFHFLQGSWRELQRVQWPDRRQVMQATGVVVGFVIVAGAFLGVADYLSTKLINFILG